MASRVIIFLCLVLTAYGALPKYRASKKQQKPGDDIDGKIVGGQSGDISQFPYQVSLQAYGSHICGGSVISETAVLTAAHCVTFSSNVNPRDLSVRVGSTYHDNGGQVYRVSEITVHPSYSERTTNNDVAVLKLSTPIARSTGAMIITLGSTEPVAGQTIAISGWGSTSEGGSSPRQLQFATVPVISRTDCQNQYRNVATITRQMFCAAYKQGGVDSCQGDSGGPAVNGGRQVGVVSWGIGCARAGAPGVYANVSALRSWIRQTAGI